MALKIFVHMGAGHYVGSAVIVVAGTRPKAEELIRKELDDHGLEKEDFEITEKEIETGVVYVRDGDY